MNEITAALKLADKALLHNRWATLHVTDNITTLEIGPIKPDGSREHKSATYRFYTDAVGIVHYVTQAHP